MKTPNPGLRDAPRSVLGRTLEVLDCFGRDQTEQSVSGICRATGLPPATVHRILASLVEWGGVERTGRGRYQLGERLWRLGHWVPDMRVLRDVARPFLVDLYDAAHAPVVLAGLDGDRVFSIDRISGRAGQHVWPHRMSFSALNHAAGLVYLTWGSRALPLKQHMTPTAALRRELAAIKTHGYASTVADGLTWVAAPLVDETREVRAAVCLGLGVGQGSAVAASRLVVPAARSMSEELSRIRIAE